MKKTLIFLGIDIEASLMFSMPYAKKFDVNISIEEDKIALEGKNAKQACEAIKEMFGDKVIVSKEISKTLIETLKAKAKTISTAESCTGGLLAYEFTKNPGASEVYIGGIVSYANEVKQNFLGVKSIQDYGAVSEIVVKEMLEGAIFRFKTDYALATSGVAGPGGGSEQKPVGTVYIGVQKAKNLPIVERYLFQGNREEIQKQSCKAALVLLFKNL